MRDFLMAMMKCVVGVTEGLRAAFSTTPIRKL